jgi:protease YdgD
MFRNSLRCVLMLATLNVALSGVARAQTIAPADVHREAVDVSQYPWSSIGKLYNETGGGCTAVIIGRDKVLTAAHCVFNFRSRQYIQAQFLHFLAGYRSGQYKVHARVVSYEIGAGFDPLRYDATNTADWAVLTLTEALPADIEPLALSQRALPEGTKAVIAGYPQDRAFAMTADGDCELRQQVDGGGLFLHTCRGTRGYSGAPILVSAGGKVEVAGIHIAAFESGGTQKMVALPARTVRQALKADDPATDVLFVRNNVAGNDISPRAFG